MRRWYLQQLSLIGHVYQPPWFLPMQMQSRVPRRREKLQRFVVSVLPPYDADQSLKEDLPLNLPMISMQDSLRVFFVCLLYMIFFMIAFLLSSLYFKVSFQKQIYSSFAFFLSILYLFQDINECEMGNPGCHQNAACVNTVGSYQCVCDSLYTGNGSYCTRIGK